MIDNNLYAGKVKNEAANSSVFDKERSECAGSNSDEIVIITDDETDEYVGIPLWIIQERKWLSLRFSRIGVVHR